MTIRGNLLKLAVVGFFLAVNFNTYCRVKFLQTLGLYFWTGFLEDAVEIAPTLREKVQLLVLMEHWDRAAELFKRDYFPAFDANSSDIWQGIDYNAYLVGVRTLFVNGEYDEALDRLVAFKGHARTEAQWKEMEKIRAQISECIEVRHNQTDHIHMAMDVAEGIKFMDMPDPYVYFCYHGFVFLALLKLLHYSWIKKWRLLTVLCLVLMVAQRQLWVMWHSKTPLFRMLNGEVIFESKVTSWLTPDRPAPPALERARQYFLSYPWICTDVKDRTAIGLVIELMTFELRRCDREVMKHRRQQEASLEHCQSAHKAAYGLASMLEWDRYSGNRYRGHVYYTHAEKVLTKASYLPQPLPKDRLPSDRLRHLADRFMTVRGIAWEMKERIRSQDEL